MPKRCGGFDPTNNTLADARYVKVAVGRDYEDVAPIRDHLRLNDKSQNRSRNGIFTPNGRPKQAEKTCVAAFRDLPQAHG